MVISVTFNKRLPPAAANAGRGTLAELMAKQKAAAEAQSTAAAQPSPTIMQGFGNLAQTFAQGIREGRATSDLRAQEAGQAKLMGEIDPATGATNAQIAAAGQYDPELMKTLWADRATKLREDAKRENWQPLLDSEKQRFGIDPNDGIAYKINVTTGDVEPVGGKGGGVTVQNMGEKVETEWGKKLAGKLADMTDADIVAGKDANVQLGELGVLDDLVKSGNMLSGTEAGIADWAKRNLGVTLGDKASATTLFNSIVDKMVPSQRAPGSGSVSNYDAQMYKSALANMMNSPEANKLIIGQLKGLAQYNQKVALIAQQASMIENPQDARKFYFEKANELGNPLQDYMKQLEEFKKTTEAPNPQNPPPPANPDNPQQTTDQPVPNADPDPNKPHGGVKLTTRNPDGSTTIEYHDNSKVRILKQ